MRGGRSEEPVGALVDVVGVRGLRADVAAVEALLQVGRRGRDASVAAH